MKHALFLSLFIFSGVCLLSCQSDSAPAADHISFTLDGKSLTLTAGYSIKSFTAPGPFGMYAPEDPSDTRTLLGAGDAETGGKYYITVSFSGKEPGNCAPESIYIAVPQGYFLQTSNTKLSITVNEYGAVGKKIRGSFSGTLPLFEENGMPTTTECGVDGTFCVTRRADTSF